MNRPHSVEELIGRLVGKAISIEQARSARGLPAQPGIYAWWTRSGSIPRVPRCPHPQDDLLDLFYIGIAPKDERSSATLRSRVGGNHIEGNVGSSTFRLTLASVLFQEKGWKPAMRDRPLLKTVDNKALTA